jgi:hypothetical protein
VITNGKVRHEGEESRDFNKDAGARAGLLRVNADKTTFVDFFDKSENGDRYRGIAVVGNTAYVMRTQKDKVDSTIRVAAIDLTTNEVTMIEEKGVTVHGSETPKTFCGHFNFGRPITVGTKIVYPPIMSGMIIVFDTVTNTFTVHETEEKFASIHSVYVEELNEVVFFPYGKTTNKLLTLDMETNTITAHEAPTNSAFYHVNTNGSKAIGAPLIMDGTTEFNFWIYDGETVQSVAYDSSSTDDMGGQMGFKYGTMNGNTLLTHTCWEGCKEFVSLNLDTLAIDNFETNESLGSKPVINAGDVYLFPSIQNPSMINPTTKVFKVEGQSLTEIMDLGTANITSGSINDTDSVTMLAPYKFDFSDAGLGSDMAIVDLNSKTSKLIPVNLSLEIYEA